VIVGRLQGAALDDRQFQTAIADLMRDQVRAYILWSSDEVVEETEDHKPEKAEADPD